MRQDPTSRRRLAALGIDVWVERGAPSTSDAAIGSGPDARPADDGEALRIRLASGRGRWLLVLDDVGNAESEALLDDLRALLGADQVRFGRWSDSTDSGVAAGEWRDRGIDWVLDFGGRAVHHPAVLNLPTMDELRGSGAARKALWQSLRPLLDSSPHALPKSSEASS